MTKTEACMSLHKSTDLQAPIPAHEMGFDAWVYIYGDPNRQEYVCSVRGNTFLLKQHLKTLGFKWCMGSWDFGWNGRDNLDDVVRHAFRTNLPVFSSLPLSTPQL